MAAKRKSGRKARKPKFVNVEGHQLTEAMYADYNRCIESRAKANGAADALRLGLDDFLAGYRPSRKIERQLPEVYATASRVSLAIGAMGEYTFFTSEPVSIRSEGCKLLKALALELYNASAKLTAVAMNVEAEKTTKLQDWLAGDERVARIGRGGEIAHV